MANTQLFIDNGRVIQDEGFGRSWRTAHINEDHLFLQKVFRVLSWTLSEDGGIDLTLQEENSSAYAWSAAEVILDVPSVITLPAREDRLSTITLEDVTTAVNAGGQGTSGDGQDGGDQDGGDHSGGNSGEGTSL